MSSGQGVEGEAFLKVLTLGQPGRSGLIREEEAASQMC